MKSGLPVDKADLSIFPDERIEAVCSGFERAWKDGPRSPAEQPSIEEYLAGAGGSERAALLGELLMLDLEFRRRDDEYADRQGVPNRVFRAIPRRLRRHLPGRPQVEDSLAEQGLVETARAAKGVIRP